MSLLDDPTRGPPYTTDFNAAKVSCTPKDVIYPHGCSWQCQWSQGGSSGTASINSINGLMLHVPFIFCNIFQQLSNDVLLKLYKQMVTLSIVDDNLYKTQRMVSEYVLLARVYGKEFACSNRAIEIILLTSITTPQDAHMRLVLQVYLDSNTFESK